jgi:hypothetical protein
MTCNVASGFGYILGSSRDVSCTFSTPAGRPEHYAGTISKFGLDIGYVQNAVIAWTFVAPTVVRAGSVSRSRMVAAIQAQAAFAEGTGGGIGGVYLTPSARWLFPKTEARPRRSPIPAGCGMRAKTSTPPRRDPACRNARVALAACRQDQVLSPAVRQHGYDWQGAQIALICFDELGGCPFDA